MLSSILFGLLSVLGMMMSAAGVWSVYFICIQEWTDGRDVIMLLAVMFYTGLVAWGAYVAAKNAMFEFSVRNY